LRALVLLFAVDFFAPVERAVVDFFAVVFAFVAVDFDLAAVFDFAAVVFAFVAVVFDFAAVVFFVAVDFAFVAVVFDFAAVVLRVADLAAVVFFGVEAARDVVAFFAVVFAFVAAERAVVFAFAAVFEAVDFAFEAVVFDFAGVDLAAVAFAGDALRAGVLLVGGTCVTSGWMTALSPPARCGRNAFSRSCATTLHSCPSSLRSKRGGVNSIRSSKRFQFRQQGRRTSRR
jgi:hypothetical protein